MRIDSKNEHEHQGGWLGVGGFYVRDMTEHINDPRGHAGHEHYIDHAGDFLGGGELNVHWSDADGSGVYELRAPCVIHLPAGRAHRFEVVSGRPRWRCWFAKAEADRLHLDAAVNWTLEA